MHDISNSAFPNFVLFSFYSLSRAIHCIFVVCATPWKFNFNWSDLMCLWFVMQMLLAEKWTLLARSRIHSGAHHKTVNAFCFFPLLSELRNLSFQRARVLYWSCHGYSKACLILCNVNIISEAASTRKVFNPCLAEWILSKFHFFSLIYYIPLSRIWSFLRGNNSTE